VTKFDEFVVDHSRIDWEFQKATARTAGPDMAALLVRAVKFAFDNGSGFSALDRAAMLSFCQKAQDVFLWERITAERAAKAGA